MTAEQVVAALMAYDLALADKPKPTLADRYDAMRAALIAAQEKKS